MNRIFYSVLLGISFLSCNSKYATLTKYYKKNEKFHKEIANSLIKFSKSHHTEVILRKGLNSDNRIIFRYYLPENSSRMPIEFDSSFNRSDPYPEYTSNIIVPIDIIKLFRNSIYTSMIADSNSVFFGYKSNPDGNSLYGVLINTSEEKMENKIISKLSKNVYITNGIIP